jgi:hypothetical protein
VLRQAHAVHLAKRISAFSFSAFASGGAPPQKPKAASADPSAGTAASRITHHVSRLKPHVSFQRFSVSAFASGAMLIAERALIENMTISLTPLCANSEDRREWHLVKV